MALKRKAGDEKTESRTTMEVMLASPASSSSTSSQQREVRVKLERIGGPDTPNEVVGTSPTPDQMTAKKALGEQASSNPRGACNFLCPIGRKTMFNPVFADDGNNYEEHAILKYIKTRDTSPFDNVTRSVWKVFYGIYN